MSTTTTMTDIAATLRLLSWLSPAFPTGAYAYSHAIEWAVETGDVADGASLAIWLEDVLTLGSGRTDAILLRHAHAACGDRSALVAIAELARAACPSRERQAETLDQGAAFIAAAAAWHPGVLTDLAGHTAGVAYPVAVGALAGDRGIDVEAVTAGYVQAIAANYISAAVRLVPLGQSAGLRVLAGLEPAIMTVADESRNAGLDDIGGCCFRSDIAAMRHETQYTRLFRT